MRPLTFLSLFACLSTSLLFAQDYPKAEISNGLIHAELMLPDSQNGSYRGTRFDWSGIISSLRFDGHEYFGRWYEHHDPKIHDAITGPVEAFQTDDKGLGYDEAKAGIGLRLEPGPRAWGRCGEERQRRCEQYCRR